MQSRQPRGIPAGGEFAGNEHDEASASLGAAGKPMLPDGMRDRYAGGQRGAFAGAIARELGSGTVTILADLDIDPRDDPETPGRIYANVDGYLVDADGWHNRIDELERHGVELDRRYGTLDPGGSDAWEMGLREFDDVLNFRMPEYQDERQAREAIPHVAAARPPEDLRPWYANGERDWRCESLEEARDTGSAGGAYDPRV